MTGLTAALERIDLAPALAGLGRGALIIGLLIVALAFIRRIRPAIGRLVTVPGTRGTLADARRAETLGHVVVRSLEVAVILIAGFVLLAELGFQIAPILAGAGVVGIAIGLGAQTLVRDVLAGVFVLSENQYARGELVRVAGIVGTVEDVNLRRTIVRDAKGEQHSIPNGEIRISSNLSRDWASLEIEVLYGRAVDSSIVLETIERSARARAATLQDIIEPPGVARVSQVDESTEAVVLSARVRPGSQTATASALARALAEALGGLGLARYRVTAL